MSISKLQFIQEKKTSLGKQQRRQLADLLQVGKEQSARIRVENLIREEVYVELCEMLELYCELLLARIALIDNQAECDPGLEEAIKVIIYCTPHTEVKELAKVRDLLVHRYGPEFYRSTMENESGIIPKKILDRVNPTAPSEQIVLLYLKEIAKTYDVPFSELSDDESDLEELEKQADQLDLLDTDKKVEKPTSKPEKGEARNVASGNGKTKATFVPSSSSTIKNKKTSSKNDLTNLRERFEALKKG